jgi:hypothetical protein
MMPRGSWTNEAEGLLLSAVENPVYRFPSRRGDPSEGSINWESIRGLLAMFHFRGTTVPNAAACGTKLRNLLKKINGEEAKEYEAWKERAGIAAVRTTITAFRAFKVWVGKRGAEEEKTREAWLVGVLAAEATEAAAHAAWKEEAGIAAVHTSARDFHAFKAWKEDQGVEGETTHAAWLVGVLEAEASARATEEAAHKQWKEEAGIAAVHTSARDFRDFKMWV